MPGAYTTIRVMARLNPFGAGARRALVAWVCPCEKGIASGPLPRASDSWAGLIPPLPSAPSCLWGCCSRPSATVGVAEADAIPLVSLIEPSVTLHPPHRVRLPLTSRSGLRQPHISRIALADVYIYRWSTSEVPLLGLLPAIECAIVFL